MPLKRWKVLRMFTNSVMAGRPNAYGHLFSASAPERTRVPTRSGQGPRPSVRCIPTLAYDCRRRRSRFFSCNPPDTTPCNQLHPPQATEQSRQFATRAFPQTTKARRPDAPSFTRASIACNGSPHHRADNTSDNNPCWTGKQASDFAVENTRYGSR